MSFWLDNLGSNPKVIVRLFKTLISEVYTAHFPPLIPQEAGPVHIPTILVLKAECLSAPRLKVQGYNLASF